MKQFWINLGHENHDFYLMFSCWCVNAVCLMNRFHAIWVSFAITNWTFDYTEHRCDCGVLCGWLRCLVFSDRCSNSALIWIRSDILLVELPDGVFVAALAQRLLIATVQRIFHYCLELREIAVFHRWKNRIVEISSAFFDIIVSKCLNETEKEWENKFELIKKGN